MWVSEHGKLGHDYISKDSFTSQKEVGIFSKLKKSVDLVWNLHSITLCMSGKAQWLPQFPIIPASSRAAEREVKPTCKR